MVYWGPLSGKAILLNLVPKCLIHPTHPYAPDIPDAYFVVVDMAWVANQTYKSVGKGIALSNEHNAEKRTW